MCDSNNPSTSKPSSMDNDRYKLQPRANLSMCGVHRNCFPLGNPFSLSTSENISFNGPVPEYTFTYGIPSLRVIPKKIFCSSTNESATSASRNKRLSKTVNENCKKKRKIKKNKKQTQKFLSRPVSKYHATEGYSLKKKNVSNKRTKQRLKTNNNQMDKEENVNLTVHIEINDNLEANTCEENNDESITEQERKRFIQPSQESTENIRRYNILDDIRFLGYAPYAFAKDFMNEVIHVIKEL